MLCRDTPFSILFTQIIETEHLCLEYAMTYFQRELSEPSKQKTVSLSKPRRQIPKYDEGCHLKVKKVDLYSETTNHEQAFQCCSAVSVKKAHIFLTTSKANGNDFRRIGKRISHRHKGNQTVQSIATWLVCAG